MLIIEKRMAITLHITNKQTDDIIFSNFLKEQNLLPSNIYFQKRDDQRWTFVVSIGGKAQLDYIIKNGRRMLMIGRHTIHLKEWNLIIL